MSDGNDDIFPTAPRQPAEGAAPRPADPPEPPASPPASERVVLEFGSFREFIDDYSPHISTAGLFLLDSARRPGDTVAFEVRLSDDFRLIHGVGEVEWTVPPGTPGRRAGAALRFTELDEPSRRLVARLVDNHRSGGGTPFDLDDRPAAPAAAAGPPAVLPAGLEPAAGLGAETIALPTTLAGRGGPGVAEPGSEEPPPLEPPPGSEPPPVEPPPRVEPPPPLEAPPAPAREPADDEPGPEAELPGEVELMPPVLLEEPAAVSEPPPRVDRLAGPGAPEPSPPAGGDAAPVGGLDGVPTELFGLEEPEPEPPPIPLEDLAPSEPVAELPDPAAPDREPPPPDAGFEPAELPHVPEIAPPGSAEEVLPVMPLDGDSPAAAESAGAAPVPRPAAETPPVEMPDREELVADYYRASGPPRRSRTFLWVALCVLAVVAGAAAWRYKESWLGLLPGSDAGVAGEPAAAAADPGPAAGPAAAPADRPAAAPAAAPGAVSAEPPEPSTAAVGAPPTEPPPGETAAAVAADPPAAADRELAGEPAEEAAPAAGVAAPEEAEPAADEPTPTAASDPAAGPRRLTDLSFRVAGGVTEVVIVADAAIPAGGFELVRVAQPPARQVIKVFGPVEPYPREAVAVGSEHVRRLRTGVHRVGGRAEIHVVADLTGPGVVVLDSEVRGRTLIVRFGRR